MGLRRYTTLLLFLLLLVPLTLAEDACYKENVCDTGYESRLSDAIVKAETYYRLFGLPVRDDPHAYPSALLLLSQPDEKEFGEQILLTQLDRVASPNIPGLDEAFYIAWILAKDDNALLATETRTKATQALNDYFGIAPIPSRPEEIFLFDVTKYLRNGEHLDKTTDRLRTNGKEGWPDEIEQSPARLAIVMRGLFALYDQAENEELRKLAEMNLDLLLTLYGASQVDGAWVTPIGEETFANDAYHPEMSPWSGWGFLLLDTSDPTYVTEPSALVSGYCAHAATRRIAKSPQRTLNQLTTKGNLLSTHIGAEYAIAASQDVGGKTFEPNYASKARLTFGDPRAFIAFSTRISDESTDIDAATAQQTALFSNGRVMLGNMAGDDCREPHILFGDGFDSSLDYAAFLDRKGGVFHYGNVYGVIRFTVPMYGSPVAERYAERANMLPSWLAGEAPLPAEDAGFLLYPSLSSAEAPNRGLFAVEIIPNSAVTSFLDDCQAERAISNELDCLAWMATERTALSWQGGRINYTSRLVGSRTLYQYVPGLSATINGAPMATENYALRSVIAGSSILSGDSSWTIKNPVDGIITLDFDASVETMKQGSHPSKYACPDDPQVEEPVDERSTSGLGFAASSFLANLDEYAIDCAPRGEALPNPVRYLAEGTDAEASCVVAARDELSVALIFPLENAPDDPPRLQEAIRNLVVYYPFDDQSKDLSIDAAVYTSCDAAHAASLSSNDFIKCSKSIPESGQYLWVNGKHNVLIVTTDSNPFTSGWWADGIGDWWGSLFGDQAVPGVLTEDVYDAAYFYSKGGREIRATIANNEAEVTAFGLTSPFSTFMQGESLTWSAFGSRQQLTFRSERTDADSLWGRLTRSLRVTDVGGSPFSQVAYCGEELIDYPPECDVPSEALRACTAGNLNEYVVCASDCLIDESACFACEDKDGDGEFDDCGSDAPYDCYDANPATAEVVCAPEMAEDVGCVANEIFSCDSEVDCDLYPFTACPQCVHHPPEGEFIYDICDGQDNDCDGVKDPYCPNVLPTSDDSWSCVTTAGCGFICDIEITLPDCVCGDDACVESCKPTGSCSSDNADCTTLENTCTNDGDCENDEMCHTFLTGLRSCVPYVDCTVNTQCSGGFFCDQKIGGCRFERQI